MFVKKYIKLSNPCHLLSTGFGIGMLPYMPGTAGSVGAIPIWYLLIMLPWQIYLLVVFFSLLIGIFICHKTAKDIGVHDHQCIVWDEFVGIWITLIALPTNNFYWVMIGFFLFRLLDIWKPWPIIWFDRKIYSGIGIILDDVIAGSITASIIHLMNFLN